MRPNMTQTWRSLTRGKPGHRFRDRYHRHQRSTSARNWYWEIVRLLLSVLAFSVGVVLVFIPGPAIVFFILGGALLASDWLLMARLMDWIEVRLRHRRDLALRIWQRLPVGGRIALAATGAMVGAASTYGFYRLVQ
jgi:hypothetical protein